MPRHARALRRRRRGPRDPRRRARRRQAAARRPEGHSDETAGRIDDEEDAVYGAILSSGDCEGDPVVLDSVTSRSADPMVGTATMTAAFTMLDKVAVPLDSSRFHLARRVVLIDAADIEKIFASNEHDGWQWFCSRYPNASSVIARVSPVAFDRERGQAIVYVGNTAGWLAAAGFFYFLVKDEGSWRVMKRARASIS